MRTLEQMDEAAQRQLDGMTVNRDQLARDVQWLTGCVRRLEKLIKQDAQEKSSVPYVNPMEELLKKYGVHPDQHKK